MAVLKRPRPTNKNSAVLVRRSEVKKLVEQAGGDDRMVVQQLARMMDSRAAMQPLAPQPVRTTTGARLATTRKAGAQVGVLAELPLVTEMTEVTLARLATLGLVTEHRLAEKA